LGGPVYVTGLELCIDARAAHGLNSLATCSAFMDQVVQVAGMTELERFQIELPNEMQAGPGVSITCVIIESHIALHTWPERNALMFNLVSCKPFNTRPIMGLLVDTFRATLVTHHEIERTI